MDMKELNSKVVSWLIPAILGAIATTLLWLFSDFPSIILSLFAQLSTQVLSKLTIGLFLLSVVLLIWIYFLQRNLKTKLKPFFGMLWDKTGNSYCPSCKNLLTNYGTYFSDTGYGFRCLHCKDIVYLRSEENPLQLSEAKEILSENF